MSLIAKQQQIALGRATRPSAARVVVCKASNANMEVPRRAALGMLAGAAALATGTAPSFAAYGDSANIFGKVTNTSGLIPYAGDGFALTLPAKWNPSKEQDYAKYGTTELRYEDNGDSVNNVVVLTSPTDKASITDFGTPEKFLESVSYLFGKQAFSGETLSEGGFAPNKVAAVSVLDISEGEDKNKKKYYRYQALARSADDNEGGRHNLISATVSGGKLWIFKVQIGDKRWIKGASKDAEKLLNSFTVA